MGLKLIKRDFTKANKIEDKEFYSVEETSEISGMSVYKLRRYLNKGKNKKTKN